MTDTTDRLHFHFSFSCIGEGNGNPLQYSCLEDPRDGGAWLAAVYGVAQSWTRLKRLSSSSSSKAINGHIISWQIDGETVETVADFIFWGSKITSDGDYSHEIKRHLLLGRKVMTNLDSILKSRAITLSTKVCLVKAMVFPVVMTTLM